MLNNKTQLHNIPIKSSDNTAPKYLINHTITPSYLNSYILSKFVKCKKHHRQTFVPDMLKVLCYKKLRLHKLCFRKALINQ